MSARSKETILRERGRGEFTSLPAFLLRVQPMKEEMEAMIQAGAFDDFGKSRTTQYWEFKSLAANRTSTARTSGPAVSTLAPPETLAAEQTVPAPRQLWLFP